MTFPKMKCTQWRQSGLRKEGVSGSNMATRYKLSLSCCGHVEGTKNTKQYKLLLLLIHEQQPGIEVTQLSALWVPP